MTDLDSDVGPLPEYTVVEAPWVHKKTGEPGMYVFCKVNGFWQPPGDEHYSCADDDELRERFPDFRVVALPARLRQVT